MPRGGAGMTLALGFSRGRGMTTPHLLIIGGGLAGLSAGCYALRSGFRVTIVEHNLALGGVCTAWHRPPYVVDGCIHWLTGGEFSRVYDELGILARVPTRTLETFVTYRDARDELELTVTRDLDALVRTLAAISPIDTPELERLRQGAARFVAMKPPIDAPELMSFRERIGAFWDGREAVGPLMHFRQSIGDWSERHLESPRLRRFFTKIFPESAPAFFLMMVLGYLERGFLSRPVGGTEAFRSALEQTYRSEGGEVVMPATVDEILVEGNRASGVRLADGSMLAADFVLSAASGPETVLRLLGGRYDAATMRERLAHWKLFDPIVLASFGVALPFADAPALSILDGLPPLEIGGRTSESIYVRVCNDDASMAPPGHCVVQAMLPTDYAWWATRGSRYGAAKDAVAHTILRALEPSFPGLGAAVRMRDIATPLTYWSMARSWRGSYEGWMPTPDAFFTHPKKTLSGLSRFYMAGQWVEPGGGVPTTLASGRHAVQLLCKEAERAFVAVRSTAAG
jgi:phytoene dehydrogenase-like protein